MLNTMIDMRRGGQPVCSCTGCNSDSHVNGGRCNSKYNGVTWKHATGQDGKLYDTCPKCLHPKSNCR